METITLTTPMPESIKTCGGGSSPYAWYLTTGEFIGCGCGEQLVSAMQSDDTDLGEAPDIGAYVCDLYKVEVTNGTEAEISYGPSGIFQVQYDAIQAAGIIE